LKIRLSYNIIMRLSYLFEFNKSASL
jgi:hypothetical protein